MSIWQKAFETYEYHAHLAGEAREGWQTLTPVGHIVQKTQIELTVDGDGSFHSAQRVDQKGEDCKCIIPATEASASRTQKPVPHPLCEQLKYLIPGTALCKGYLEQLTAWANSPHATPKVRAILSYVQGGTILKDLEGEKLVQLKADGTLAAGKSAGADYEKCMIRWKVFNTGAESAVWKDRELFDAYLNFLQAGQKEAPGLCMISGQPDVLAASHPKGTLANAYGAKLISSNDSSGFTYRGRFLEPDQAASIGYLASQKVHSALQWLCANQGVIKGGRTFLCWNPKGKPVFQVLDPWADPEDMSAAEPSDYKKRLEKTLEGLKNDLPDEEDVVIAAFEAATTGRLSITHYSEMKASDFHRRIRHWMETTAMPDYRHQIRWTALELIVKCAYGSERGKWLDVDEQILREHLQRLLRCMTEGAAIPAPLVKALCDKASHPLYYKEWNNRALVMFTACAMLRKYLNDLVNKEEWTMVLDKKQTDRSYLYGRMLAVLEYAERSAYNPDETRETNAIRMQAVFAQRPQYGEKILEERLVSYYQKLKRNKPNCWKRCRELMEEIQDLFLQEDWNKMNDPLDGKYLLGYYQQRNDLYKRRKDRTESEEE